MTRNQISDWLLLLLLGLAIVFIPSAVGAQTVTVLYNFGTGILDPLHPTYPGIIAQGSDGVLYSTAPGGGNYPQEGSVFSLTPSGQLTSLYSFGGTFVLNEGSIPVGGLTLGTDGNFYGTTSGGGIYGGGIVFKITPSGLLTKLYDFTGGSDGSGPMAPPIQGSDGNFYGTTYAGANNYGTVFKITPSGKFTTIHSFAFSEGSAPYAPLVQGTDGNFYGTTTGGGSNGNLGTVFKITPAGKLTTLHSFDAVHGTSPYAPLIQGSDGNFYGTTFLGGSNGCGLVFKITTAGKFTVLYNFCPITGCADGEHILSGLVQGSDGNFFGVASSGGTAEGYGTIYKISSTGAFSVLYAFDLPTGWTPVTLMQHTNGLLYGEATGGGTGSSIVCGSNCGTAYSLDVGLGPFVSFLRQQSPAKVGGSIGIFGQGFAGATGVSFGGTRATFTVSSDTYLITSVPAGALTGPITVETSGGSLTSNRTFRVTPQVKSFSPTSGTIATSVQITGVSLAQTSRVSFGGVKATTFTVNSDTQVTATVPTGAKTGRIAITTAGGTSTSATSFTVTP